MRNTVALASLLMAAGCSTTPMHEPSLAPRAAESIDPRLPVRDTAPSGQVDAALAQRLQQLVGVARGATAQFNAQESETSRLAASAGPTASESWIAAQEALSRLVERHGVTTRAAGDIDALAGNRLQSQHWIRPADRQAIKAAAAEVAAINEAQSGAIRRLAGQLAR